ncbi:MAG: N-formylglutamate amidohydrolase [Lysobacterales bacterium CG17_big_fil_post_rev_8_21_14_2_50_64_11]|nr:MAG: N-formylglutamate amidohydrolase [Xanthomonadales bacterium CG17_big_fil_post_rev_8_21_14_2_50_64_11]
MINANTPLHAATALSAPPFAIHNADGRSGLLLLCEHASNHIPAQYHGLGLSREQQHRHIAWDIGALAVATALSSALDAPLVFATYSRLLLDLNRPIDADDSIVAHSEDTAIPGNDRLDPGERALRQRALYHPFHAAVARLIDARLARGQATALLSMHSFTPTYLGVSRPWHVGVLAEHDRRLADALLRALRADPALCVGDNQPYAPSQGVYHSMDRHGQQRGLACAMIELRNDLIAQTGTQRAWAERLCAVLTPALARH